MRPWLALLLLASVFAGCTEVPEDGLDDANDPGDPDGSDGNQAVPPVQGDDLPPTARLSADVLNGTAPLEVNLTLEGSDPEGGNLSWALLVNGTQSANGTRLPHEIGFILGAGNYTVLLVVSDGKQTATANLTVVVVAAEGPTVDPNAPEDRGWYFYDPVTQRCPVKAFTGYGSGPATVYVATLSGGTWVLAETNGVPGLQVADNHPGSGHGAGFELNTPGCKNGDQVLV